jgi:large subunit ribosomal protein L32
VGGPGKLDRHHHPRTFRRRACREREEIVMAVPKRKQSRANTHARRSQWKATPVQLVKTIENGKVVYSLPHRAKVVEDSAGTPLYLEYKGRKVADV